MKKKDTVSLSNVVRSPTSRFPLYRDGKGGISPWESVNKGSIFEKYREDPKTGMPVPLEKGEYFRVSTTATSVKVSYMRKRWWWFDVELSEDSMYIAHFATPVEADDILRLGLTALILWSERNEEVDRMFTAMREEEERVRRLKKLQKSNSRFDGNYPPKVLK